MRRWGAAVLLLVACGSPGRVEENDLAVPLDLTVADQSAPDLETADLTMPDLLALDLFMRDLWMCSSATCMVDGGACCSNACVDVNSDSKNCGVCNHGCADRCCAALCVDTSSDPGNCGGCGNLCPPVANSRPGCSVPAGDGGTNSDGGTGAVCTAMCNVNWGDCNGVYADGCETDLTQSQANCGACGHACSSGSTCMLSLCVANPVTVTMTFPHPSPPPTSSQCTQWNGFRSQIDSGSTYFSITLSGGKTSLQQSVSCTDSVAPGVANQICQALRNPSAGTTTFTCGSTQWAVTNGCGGAGAVELSANNTGSAAPVCTCFATGIGDFAVRPCSDLGMSQPTFGGTPNYATCADVCCQTAAFSVTCN